MKILKILYANAKCKKISCPNSFEQFEFGCTDKKIK
uniref:Bm14203 n=1 Tax=Brugia malayi TaxID=6279 RepID=A0A1I9G2C0_BRUMA|nr:Bm14203 [Brugia malayi]